MRVWRGLAACIAMLWQAQAFAADLSPGRWPAALRGNLERRDLFFTPPYAGSVRGRSMLVTGTASRVAVHAGIEALRQGGTAADSAAAVALTQVTLEAGSVTSFAGIGQLVYFDAKTQKVYALDSGWNSYASETDPGSIPSPEGLPGQAMPAKPDDATAYGRQTLVPGFMAGIGAMQARFGRLPFADLLQPAIWYADHGITVTPTLAAYFRLRQGALWRTPEGRRFASMPDGSLPKLGDVFKQPGLATTLRAVAARGPSYMYTGDWAQAFVAAVQANGGKATLDDLARYQPHWSEPLSLPFEGATLYAPAEDPRGSCPTLTSLNLLAGMQVERLGPYWSDPAALRAHMRALWFSEYGTASPDVAAAERSGGFNGCADRLTARYGQAFGPSIETLGVPTPTGASASAPEIGGHTQAVIVVDRWGDVAAFVHTINAVNWGDTGIVVGGIPLSDAAAFYKPVMVGLKPGDRLPNGLTPMIALKDGKPVLAVASVGNSIVPETVRLIAGILAGHDDPATLMAAPPLLNLIGPQPNGSLWAWPEPVRSGAYDAATLKAFADAGAPTQLVGAQQISDNRGTAVMAIIDPGTGASSAVEVPEVFDVAESDRGAGPPPPSEVAVPTDVLDRYVGDYQVNPTVVTHVSRQGDHLYVDTTGRPRLELFARSPTEFFETIGDAEVRFEPSDDGKTVIMAVRRGGVGSFAPRIAPRAG
jgi:gamma-glutamyltranspeptidase / glutathione hydrolase